MSIVEWIGLVPSVGFPVAVSGYLLYVFNTTLKENTVAIRELKAFLEGKTIGGDHG